jgi:chaperonin GroES
MEGRILSGMILVSVPKVEEKTVSGIILPDTAKEKPCEGKVVMIGTDKRDEPMEVEVGETVVYGKYAGTELTLNNKTFLLMKQSEVLCIITKL